ncbi:MAG: squalene/phytoene synthase family protein [Verrucomicrobiales bacterium]|nr:squalene/phytoene synthase family protein [Verrucomicrobiales bacterium]
MEERIETSGAGISTIESSNEIVRRSGSNLAFALAVLPRHKRADMGVFYAFCRVVDDLADDPDLPMETRRAGLSRWRSLIREEIEDPAPGIESEWCDLQERYRFKKDEVEAIIDGVEMDLEPLRFETADELREYCFRVASAVGLVSIEIFGYTDPGCREYARQLGYALQWTNILRDVGEDAAEGRVFLPREDLKRFGISEEEILAAQPDPASFGRLMKDQTRVARRFYAAAEEALPDCDRKSMRSAELMRRIYSGILDAMEGDGYRVFEKRYRLSKPRMIGEFLRTKFFYS